MMKNTMLTFAPLLFCLALICPCIAYDLIYIWTDENSIVHISDVAPLDGIKTVTMPNSRNAFAPRLADIVDTRGGHDQRQSIALSHTDVSQESPNITRKVGHFSYQIIRCTQTRHLSQNKYLDQPSQGIYVVVELIVRNDSKESRVIPAFKLIDNTNAVHDSSSAAAIVIKESFRPFEKINPGVERKGVVVFDVPRGRSYNLILFDGKDSPSKIQVPLGRLD